MFQCDWAAFKSFVNARSLEIQYLQINNKYCLFAVDGALSLECLISDIEGNSDTDDFVNNFKSNANKSLGNRTPVQKTQKVSVYPPEGSSTVYVSHDWTDKTTWHQKSTRVTDETVTSLLGYTYVSAHTNWIDLTHGKIYDEDTYASACTVVVKVNDVVQSSGYTIDYAAGSITFSSSKLGTTVKVTYSYAGSSVWTLGPASGKVLNIQHAEVQFYQNVTMNAAMLFEIWVYNPYDLPNKMLYQRIKYKNEKDIINSANLGQGIIPQFGNLADDVLVFPFNYATIKSFKYSQGAELRVSVENDVALTGGFATVTFYILSQDE